MCHPIVGGGRGGDVSLSPLNPPLGGFSFSTYLGRVSGVLIVWVAEFKTKPPPETSPKIQFRHQADLAPKTSIIPTPRVV